MKTEEGRRAELRRGTRRRKEERKYKIMRKENGDKIRKGD